MSAAQLLQGDVISEPEVIGARRVGGSQEWNRKWLVGVVVEVGAVGSWKSQSFP